jgi:hypothetical protein
LQFRQLEFCRLPDVGQIRILWTEGLPDPPLVALLPTSKIGWIVGRIRHLLRRHVGFGRRWR